MKKILYDLIAPCVLIAALMGFISHYSLYEYEKYMKDMASASANGLDTMPPDIKLQARGAGYVNGGVSYYRDAGSAYIEISASDDGLKDSGLSLVYMTINGNRYDIYADDDGARSISYGFYLSDYQSGEVYKIVVYAEDVAHNSDTALLDITIDSGSPVVSGICVGDLDQWVYEEIVPVKVEAEFIVIDQEKKTVVIDGYDTGVGLGGAEYYLEEYDEKKSVSSNSVSENSISENSASQNSVSSNLINQQPAIKKKEISIDGKIYIELPENYRGRLKLRLYDKIGNYSEWITTKSFVTEDESKFLESSNIVISLPETDKRDMAGNPLYNRDIDILVSVSEDFGGIMAASYSITAGGSAVITGQLDYDSPEYEGNLLIAGSGELPISLEDNNISLVVTLQGMSGYSLEKQVLFSVDKTAPVISMNITDGTHDTEYTDYYNTNVGVTIDIEDTNINPGNVELGVNGSRYDLSDILSINGGSGRAYISFSTDGVYDMNLVVRDLAGNESEDVTLGFVIDSTPPVINVIYLDNSQSDYLNHSRKAQIEIIDDNSVVSRVALINDGVGIIDFDDSSLGLSFDDDGFYLYHIEARDKAGNLAEGFRSAPFIIDTIPPGIELTGLEVNKSYNSDITGKILMDDVNIDEATLCVSIEGNDGSSEISGYMDYETYKYTFDIANIPNEKMYDGKYKLTALATDKADNSRLESYEFIINRYGSTFDINDELKACRDSYIQDAPDIHIYEDNVDNIEKRQLSIIYNGQRTVLDEESYTYNHVYKSGRHYYDYYIDSQLFSKDGSYRVEVFTVDRAGNVNYSDGAGGPGTISFVVDKTPPMIAGILPQSGQRIREKSYSFDFFIRDNSSLEKVEVVVDGTVIYYYEGSGIPQSYSISLVEARDKHNISITAMDMAGNIMDYSINDILVKTTFFDKMMNDYNILVGSVMDAIGIVGLMATRRKKIVSV